MCKDYTTDINGEYIHKSLIKSEKLSSQAQYCFLISKLLFEKQSKNSLYNHIPYLRQRKFCYKIIAELV